MVEEPKNQPDYFVTAAIFDPLLGRDIDVEIGVAYQYRKQQKKKSACVKQGGWRIYLHDDPACKQHLFEAETLDVFPFSPEKIRRSLKALA